jgi:hypothetical protein
MRISAGSVTERTAIRVDGGASAEAVTRETTAGVAAAKTAGVATKTAGVAAKTTAAVTSASVLGPQRYRQHQRKRRNGHPTAHTKIIIRPHCNTPKPAST